MGLAGWKFMWRQHILVPESTDQLYLGQVPLWSIHLFILSPSLQEHLPCGPRQRTGTQETEVNHCSAVKAHLLLAKRSQSEAWPGGGGGGHFILACGFHFWGRTQRGGASWNTYLKERGQMIGNKYTTHYNLPRKPQLFLKAWFLKDANKAELG